MIAQKSKWLPVALLIAFFGAQAHGAEFSDADLDFFLQESYSADNDVGEESTIEDQFYRIAARADAPASAISEFARELGVSERIATGYAHALTVKVRHDQPCDEPCELGPESELYEVLLGAGFQDNTGRLAVSLGQTAQRFSATHPIPLPTLIAILAKHPARAYIFSELYWSDFQPEYAAALVATEPQSAYSAAAIRHVSSTFVGCNTQQSSAFLALLELSTEAQLALGREREVSLSYVEASIWTLLHLVRVEEAIRLFETHKKTVIEHVTTTAPPTHSAYWGYSRDLESAAFLLDLAYGFFAAGNTAAALELLSVREKYQHQQETPEQHNAAVAVLKELMSPSLSAEEVYDLALYGNPTKQSVKSDHHGFYFRDEYRWLHAMRDRPWIDRGLFANYLEDFGYHEMAAYLSLEHKNLSCFPIDIEDSIRELVPPKFFERRAAWSAKLGEKDTETALTLDTNSDGAKDFRYPTYDEHILPTEYRRTQESSVEQTLHGDNESVLPAGVYVPVPESAVLRYAEEQGERRILFMDDAIDRPGWIAAYGIWYQTTLDSGSTWGPPLYLGLQRFSPYEVVANSSLPLINGETLQFEVEVYRTDLRRKEGNVYISMQLSDLKRDRDGDSLLDSVEYRLGLDPESADTDGDGIIDSVDSLPLTPYTLDTPNREKMLALAILETTHGYKPGEKAAGFSTDPKVNLGEPDTQQMIPLDDTLFLIADPTIFDGLTLDSRLLVYSKEAAKRNSTGSAPFYPIRVQHIFRKPDGKEFYIVWSATWQGGEFSAICDDNACVVKQIKNWIV
ncbi:MAG: hypothetical protein AAF578_10225 [Pseudomonadota bacterium]